MERKTLLTIGLVIAILVLLFSSYMIYDTMRGGGGKHFLAILKAKSATTPKSQGGLYRADTNTTINTPSQAEKDLWKDLGKDICSKSWENGKPNSVEARNFLYNIWFSKLDVKDKKDYLSSVFLINSPIDFKFDGNYVSFPDSIKDEELIQASLKRKMTVKEFQDSIYNEGTKIITDSDKDQMIDCKLIN